MQSKMLAYDNAVTELNKARLRGTSYPIIHTLLKISQEVSTDVRHPTKAIRKHSLKILYFVLLTFH